jgi:hypothetical protein
MKAICQFLWALLLTVHIPLWAEQPEAVQPQLTPRSRAPITMNFRNIRLIDALQNIVNVTGIRIELSPDISREIRVTFAAKNVLLEDGLQGVLSLAKLTYKVIEPTRIVVIPLKD